MSEKNRKVVATLSPSHYQKFLELKKRFGQVSNDSTICILIAEEYDRIGEEERATQEFEGYLDSRGLLTKWNEWKVKNPGLGFADFLDSVK